MCVRSRDSVPAAAFQMHLTIRLLFTSFAVGCELHSHKAGAFGGAGRLVICS